MWRLSTSSNGWSLFATTLLLLATVTGAPTTLGTTTKPECHEIEGILELMENSNVCTVDPTVDVLGHTVRKATLDFSKADPKTLNEFLGQKDASNSFIFKIIEAAIVMDGNPKVENIDFANIIEWDRGKTPKNGIFVNICNNPILKSFTLKQNFVIQGPAELVYVLIYNNPLLEMATVNAIKKAASNHTNLRLFVQRGPHECRFQHPLEKKNYTEPTTDFLSKCQVVRGDFILEKKTPTQGNITLYGKNNCLRLVGVDMTNFELVPNKTGQGAASCGNGQHSEITGNKNLCGTKLEALEKYFADPTQVTIEADGSCAKACTDSNEMEVKYLICLTLPGDVEIGTWLDKPEIRNKLDKLKEVGGILSATSSQAQEIKLPELTEVKHLKITGNPKLETINVQNLKTIEELTITDNPKLSFDTIKQLKALKPKQSQVECPVSTTSVVTDVSDLAICTVIKGTLALGLQQDVTDLTVLKGKKLEGCVKVEGTKLTNVDFLEKMAINCAAGHTFKDNPNLCVPKTLGGKAVAAQGAHMTQGCGKVCTDLSQGQCEIFSGDLKITNSTAVKDLAVLKTVRGSLIVSSITLTTLDLPKLEKIAGSTAPVLLITNNQKLTTVTMPKLKKVELLVKGSPTVEMTNNPKLSNINFLPKSIRDSCSDNKAGICYHPSSAGSSSGLSSAGSSSGLSSAGSSSGDATVALVGFGAGAVGCLIILGVGGYFGYELIRNKKAGGDKTTSEKSKEATSKTTTIASVTAPVGPPLKEEKTQDSLIITVNDEPTIPEEHIKALKRWLTGLKIQNLVSGLSVAAKFMTEYKKFKWSEIPQYPKGAKLEAFLEFRESSIGTGWGGVRDPDVVCLEETRMLPVNKPRGNVTLLYVHANYVKGLNGNEIICTQGPGVARRTEFYHMILTEPVGCIVQLAPFYQDRNEEEPSPGTSLLYLPNDMDYYYYGYHGGLLEKKELIPGIIKTKFTLVRPFKKNSGITEVLPQREITHFQYLGWNENSIPATIGHVIYLLGETRLVQEKVKEKLLVHGAVGIGRTGSFVAIEFFIKEMNEKGAKFDVKEAVEKLRTMRAHSIQSVEQCLFSLEVVAEILKRVDMIPKGDKKAQDDYATIRRIGKEVRISAQSKEKDMKK